MFELLDVGGCLVVLESGNPMGSHTTRTARQLVLDIFNNVDRSGVFDASPVFPKINPEEGDSQKEQKGNKKSTKEESKMVLPPPSSTYGFHELGASVIAPCTHDMPCPLSSGTWCSFSQKVYSGMIRKSSEEKYSYVILQKKPKINKNITSPKGMDRFIGSWIDNADRQPDASNPTPLEVMERFIGSSERDLPKLLDSLIDEVDWDDYKPTLIRKEWARVLR